MGVLSFAGHCTIGLAIRLFLVGYADFHDRNFSVPYTDVDYRVYTDAARLIVDGKSPYDRATYRYTPLLALLLTPNILLHVSFGKILFSLIDVLVACLMRSILSRGGCSISEASNFALIWLYNPLTIVVSTRGNADSLAALFVLSTLYFLLQRDDPTISGFLHGLSIHFRLYPIAFSLSLYLSLREGYSVIPNSRQIKLVLACLSSLVVLTTVSYHFYGYDYLYESTIYHLVRNDARHNFSVFFYSTYLSTGQSVNIFKRLASSLPQIVLLLAISFRYSRKKDLPFGLFTQAMVMVVYNPVMTSQYFFWFLSILPLCLPNIRVSGVRCLVLTILWLLAQSVWLFDAYFLEFRGRNTFYRIWLDGIFFFIVNVKILQDLITHYDSGRLGREKISG